LVEGGYHIRSAEVTQTAAVRVAGRRQPVARPCDAIGERILRDGWTLAEKWSKLCQQPQTMVGDDRQ